MRRRILVPLGFVIALCLQGCLGGESGSTESIDGAWYATREIATFDNEYGRESDTAWFDTLVPLRKYLLIQGQQAHRAWYNPEEERIDSLWVDWIREGLWQMNGLEVTFTRTGSVLKGISTFVSGNNSYNVQVTREYRWGGAYPPPGWLPDTLASSLVGNWLFAAGYFEDNFVRQDIQADSTKPLQNVFLTVSSDSLSSWYYDLDQRTAVRTVASVHPIGGGRWLQTTTGDTIWLRLSGDTLIQSNFQGSGKRIPGFKFRNKSVRYTGVIPPPQWLDLASPKRSTVFPRPIVFENRQ